MRSGRKYSKAVFLMGWVMMLTSVFAMAGCAQNGTEAAPSQITVAQELLQYQGITYGQFCQQTKEEAEFYHALYFTAQIPETQVSIVFEGEYDEELAGAALQEDSKSIRLEGALGSLLTGYTGEMEPEEFADSLAQKDAVPEYEIVEGAGTAYYVADRYMVISFDSDGDGTVDTALEISLDGSEKIGPDSYAWMRWDV